MSEAICGKRRQGPIPDIASLIRATAGRNRGDLQ
jgi:hypothetical protein